MFSFGYARYSAILYSILHKLQHLSAAIKEKTVQRSQSLSDKEPNALNSVQEKVISQSVLAIAWLEGAFTVECDSSE